MCAPPPPPPRYDLGLSNTTGIRYQSVNPFLRGTPLLRKILDPPLFLACAQPF